MPTLLCAQNAATTFQRRWLQHSCDRPQCNTFSPHVIAPTAFTSRNNDGKNALFLAQVDNNEPSYSFLSCFQNASLHCWWLSHQERTPDLIFDGDRIAAEIEERMSVTAPNHLPAASAEVGGDEGTRATKGCDQTCAGSATNRQPAETKAAHAQLCNLADCSHDQCFKARCGR